jgi:RsiW-degrading membrane proteinase PrsW (M82 family)
MSPIEIPKEVLFSPEILFNVTFLIGLIPSLIWLFFWLREDKEHPEPKIFILKTFIYGGLGVILAAIIQLSIEKITGVPLSTELISQSFEYRYWATLLALILAMSAEEILKFLGAWFGGMRYKSFDEPVDAPVYMITSALGFAALENILYLFKTLNDNPNHNIYFQSLELRFIGPTLLHVACSAIIGMFIAFSFYKSRKVKIGYFLLGTMLAIFLHSTFNSFIIRGEPFNVIGFFGVWFFVVVIVLIFEIIKKKYLIK